MSEQRTGRSAIAGSPAAHVLAVGISWVLLALVGMAVEFWDPVFLGTDLHVLLIAGTLVIGTAAVGPRIWTGFTHRLRAVQWIPFDTWIVTLSLSAAILLREGGWIFALGGGGIWVIVRAIVDRSSPKPADRPSVLRQYLESQWMDPLPSLQNDPLNRRGVVEAAEQAIYADVEGSLVLGLNGPWGAGKTTILNDLGQRLQAAGINIVRLDAWNYREPHRLIEAYLSELRRTMDELSPTGSSSEDVVAVGKALASVRGSGLAGILSYWSSRDQRSLERARAELRRRIQDSPHRIIVFLDDLDRLDRDELQAVLRLVRLVSETSVTHVLAYDRTQVAKTLFPEDPEGTRARDYLAKVLKLELSVPLPTNESALRLLEESLEPVFANVEPETLDNFASRFRTTPPDAILGALGTPREIRRVTAATAWTWSRMQRDLNLFDLFLVTIIQYRYPHLYAQMSRQPEWFTQLRWSSDIKLSFEREPIEEARKQFFEGLRSNHERGGSELYRLLVTLLPSIAGENFVDPMPTESDARRTRRLLHPDVFHRYFQSALSPTAVPESSIEDLADHFLDAKTASDRQQVLLARIRHEVDSERIRSFLDQFPLFHKRLEGSLSDDRRRDIVLALSQSLPTVPGGGSDFLSPASTLQAWIRRIIGEMSPDKGTAVAEELIRTSESYDLLGSLVFYARWAEEHRRQSAFADNPPDGEILLAALDERLESIRDDGVQLVCGSQEDLLSNVIFRASPEFAREALSEELVHCPGEFLRILSHFVNIHIYREAPLEYSVSHESLDELVQRMDRSLLVQMIWSDDLEPNTPLEVAMVEVVRSWAERKQLLPHSE